MGNPDNTQYPETNPQKTIERILQEEIAVADQISQAKEGAEKSLTLAFEETSKSVEASIQKARVDSEKNVRMGIASAKKEAEKLKTDARRDADVFIQKGEEYIDNAVKFIIALILEKDKDQEAK